MEKISRFQIGEENKNENSEKRKSLLKTVNVLNEEEFVDTDLEAFTSDVLPYVTEGTGDRMVIIQKVDFGEIIEKYELNDDELDYMHSPSHFRTGRPLEVFSWLKISIRYVLNESGEKEKIWLIEEIQSDLLQKTKN